MTTDRFTTPPNTPERLKEIDRWMARQAQAATDKLSLRLRECADEAREFAEGIRLIEDAVGERSYCNRCGNGYVGEHICGRNPS